MDAKRPRLSADNVVPTEEDSEWSETDSDNDDSSDAPFNVTIEYADENDDDEEEEIDENVINQMDEDEDDEVDGVFNGGDKEVSENAGNDLFDVILPLPQQHLGGLQTRGGRVRICGGTRYRGARNRGNRGRRAQERRDKEENLEKVWSDKDKDPEIHQFTASSGLQVEFDAENATPIDYVDLFITDEMRFFSLFVTILISMPNNFF